jgi:hypothetical protein
VFALLKLKDQLGEARDETFRLLACKVPGRHLVIVDRAARARPDVSGRWLRRSFLRYPPRRAGLRMSRMEHLRMSGKGR